MDIWHVFSLFGGLALFLYGMNRMGEGLELAAGNRMQHILERLTTNKLLGVMLGTVITAIIQSSSATTVMVVGFVNSKLMNLSQAVNVIMGANIGTTITGQLIALNITAYAPIIAFIGFLLTMSKKNKVNYIGQVVIGLGFLFMGLAMMSDSMVPLRTSETFINIMQNISNPLAGVAIGAIFTAILQSSSASVGILQALASQGLVPFHTSMYIVLGQNIGTCITSVLASIGANKNAKKAAASHVLFNVIGTIIFITASFILPIEEWVAATAPNNPMAQIANLHTIFNLVTTALVLPFSKYLAELASFVVRGEDVVEEGPRLLYVKANTFGDNIVMITNIRQEILRMLDIAEEAVKLSMEIFKEYDESKVTQLHSQAQTIHYLDREVTKVTVEMLSRSLGQQQSETLTEYIRILSNLDRVSDYAVSIANISKDSVEKSILYSDTAKAEAKTLELLVQQIFEDIRQHATDDDFVLTNIYSAEYQIDSLTENYRNKHVERMLNGQCGAEAGLNYDKFLSHIQRIGGHLIHVAEGFSTED